MAIELVIFDCDGVLFDSEAANIGFYSEVLRRAGVPALTLQEQTECHALSSAQLFARRFADQPDVLASVRQVAQSTDYTPFYELMQPRSQVYEMLRQLRTRYRTAMATNRGLTVHGVLERFSLADLFDYAVGVLDVARPKPHPDMLLACLERFSVQPGAAVYVGDQPTDAEAALAAGLHFIGMPPVGQTCACSIASLQELPAAVAAL